MTPFPATPYDDIAEWYADWVRSTSWAHGVIAMHLASLCGTGCHHRILDVACGEGVFSRVLAQEGHEVVGIDLSPHLLRIARERSHDVDQRLSFVVDDAQALPTQADDTFDGAICLMALMDIPNLASVYAAVRRVVRTEGWFAIAITHPCFDSPHADWTPTPEGEARLLMHYLDEGTWRSRFAGGVREKVGAYHRTLTTYINEAIAAGWMLERFIEPAGGPAGQNQRIPRLVFARFRAGAR